MWTLAAFGFGLLCGLIAGAWMDRLDILYICPRCRRRGRNPGKQLDHCLVIDDPMPVAADSHENDPKIVPVKLATDMTYAVRPCKATGVTISVPGHSVREYWLNGEKYGNTPEEIERLEQALKPQADARIREMDAAIEQAVNAGKIPRPVIPE